MKTLNFNGIVIIVLLCVSTISKAQRISQLGTATISAYSGSGNAPNIIDGTSTAGNLSTFNNPNCACQGTYGGYYVKLDLNNWFTITGISDPVYSPVTGTAPVPTSWVYSYSSDDVSYTTVAKPFAGSLTNVRYIKLTFSGQYGTNIADISVYGTLTNPPVTSSNVTYDETIGRDLTVTRNLKVLNGTITAPSLTTTGIATIGGNLTAPSLTTTGDATIGGKLNIPSAGSSYFWKGTDGVDNVKFSVWDKFTLYNPTTAGINQNNTGWTIQFGARDGSINTKGSIDINGNAFFGTGTISKAYIRGNSTWSTALTPDYTWWGNDQTGFFHPAGNVIGVSIGGNEAMHITDAGVGIGTSNLLGYKFAVNGGIVCEEVKVISDVPSADYVFEKNYKLLSVPEIEQFINVNKHLPNIPSAEEFKTNGYKVGEMDEMLLRKIEELTLYIIGQNKKLEQQQAKLAILEQKLAK